MRLSAAVWTLAGRRGAPEVGFAVSDPGPARRPRPAGDLLEAGCGQPATSPFVPTVPDRPGVCGGADRRPRRPERSASAQPLERGVMRGLFFVPLVGLLGLLIPRYRRQPR